MATNLGTTSEMWYVRNGSRIRGPFSVALLSSMKQRGRIGPNTEVSPDRKVWFPLNKLGGEFDEPAGSVPPSSGELVPIGSGPIFPADPQCFVSVEGVVNGPIVLSELQARASRGLLGPTDPVWMAGLAEWVPAQQLPGLIFQGRKQRLSSWLRCNPALATSLALVLLVLFGVPAWYVVGLALQRQHAIGAKAEAERQEIERKVAQAKEDYARQEKVVKLAADREDRLITRQGQIEQKYETIRLQWATLEATKARNAEVDQRFADAKAEREEFKAVVEAAQAETRREVDTLKSMGERQVQGIEQGNDEQRRHNVKVEDEQRRHNRKMEDPG